MRKGYDKSDPNWLAREPAALGSSGEGEDKSDRSSRALGDLLDGLIEWMRGEEKEGKRLLARASTSAGPKAQLGYPVDKYSVFAEYGLFGRCSSGTTITDVSGVQRELRAPNHDLLKKCLKSEDDLQTKIGRTFSEFDNSKKVLQQMQNHEASVIRLKQFTKDEQLMAETREKFGFRFQPSGQTWEVMLEHDGSPRKTPPEAGTMIESAHLSKTLADAKTRAEDKARENVVAEKKHEVLDTSKLGAHVVKLTAAEMEQPEVAAALDAARTKSTAATWDKEFAPGTWIKAGGAFLRPRAHPRMSHPVSKGVIDRMQISLKTYSDNAGQKLTARIRTIDQAFYNFLQGIDKEGSTQVVGALQEPDLSLARAMNKAVREGGAGKEPKEWAAEAIKKIKAARETLAKLSSALSDLQSAELEKVGSAVELLIKMSNEVDVPEPTDAATAGQEACDKQMDRYCFELLRAAKQEARIDFSFLAVSLLSENDFKAWSQINPFLIEDQQAEMMQLMSLTLLHASAISHVNLLMLDTAKLDRQLQKVTKNLQALEDLPIDDGSGRKKASEAVHVESKGVVNLADQIAAALHAERHYVDEETVTSAGGKEKRVKKYDPRFLVFEFVRSLLLRNAQVDIVRKYLEGLEPENLNLIERGAKNTDDSQQDLGPHMAEGTAVKFKEGVKFEDKELGGTYGIVQKYADGKHYVQPDPQFDLKPTPFEMKQLDPFNVRPLAQQMLMGQGKTAVITPLLCLLLANGNQLPLVLLPDSLLPAGRDIVRSTFSMVILKRVYTLTCSRASTAEQRYLQMMQNAKKHHGVVMTAPASVKSVLLKFLENLILLRDNDELAKCTRAVKRQRAKPIKDGGNNERELSARARAQLLDHTGVWGKLLKHFDEAVLIMDELDWVCHPMKSELNFPIGLRKALDFTTLNNAQGRRWEIPIHLWDALFSAPAQTPPKELRHNNEAYALLGKLNKTMKKGYDRNALQRRPHTVLLDANFYRNEMLPIFADWMMLYFSAQQVGTAHGDKHRDKVRAYLGSRGDEAASEGLKLTAVEWQIVNLTHDWLHIFLPFSMKKVLRVTFGLMTQREVDVCLSNDPLTTKSRLKLAIPFVGKDVPSPASEFAQPDVMIGLTILAYRLQGLRPDDLREVTKEMQKSLAKESGQPQHRPSAVMYADWVTEAGGEICGMPAPAAARSDEALQLGKCVLHLDSRSVASSDGTPSNSIWRDLSGHWLDIDVCADHGEVHVGYKCARTEQTPIFGERYVLLEKEVNPDTGERRELEPHNAGYETLCKKAYESLVPEEKNNFRQALRGRVLMSRVGGFYRCFPGTPLLLPKALTLNAGGQQILKKRGVNTASLKDTDTVFSNSAFTLSVIVQATPDDEKKSNDEELASAEGTESLETKARAIRDLGDGHKISRLPISFGEDALQIGCGPSVESLRFCYAGTKAADAELELDESLAYQVGARGSTEGPQLHQFVFEDNGEKRTVKYFVNGAPLGEVLLKSAKLFSPGSQITVGRASDGNGSTWHFDGFIFLLMVHAEAMSDDILLDMHKNLMLAPEEYGAPRPGDESPMGAQLTQEMQTLEVQNAMLVIDSRHVTHRAMYGTDEGPMADADASPKAGAPAGAATNDDDEGKITTGEPALERQKSDREWYKRSTAVKGVVAIPMGSGSFKRGWVSEAVPKGGELHQKITELYKKRDSFGQSSPVRSSTGAGGSAEAAAGASAEGSDEASAKARREAQERKASRLLRAIPRPDAGGEFDAPTSQLMQSTLENEFTCTAVLRYTQCSSAPMVLTSEVFFPAIADYLKTTTGAGGAGKDAAVKGRHDGTLEVHTFTMQSLATGQHSLSYFINGKLHYKQILQKIDGTKLGKTAQSLYQKLYYNDVVGRIREYSHAGGGATKQAKLVRTASTLARPSKEVEKSDAQAAADLFDGHVYFWLFHRHALKNDAVRRIAAELVGHKHSKPWEWGRHPSMQIGAAKMRLSARGFNLLSLQKALEGALFTVRKDVTKKPRVQPLFQLDNYADDGLLALLKDSQSVQKFYLRSIVFPTLLLFQNQKISASGADLGGKFMFQKRIGFTGTPSDLLPAGLGKCKFAEGAEGEIVHTLTSPTIMRLVDHSTTKDAKDWTSEMLLTMIANDDPAFEQPLHALIDTGALITGMSNKEVAKFLMEKGLDRRLDGVVYLGDNDTKMIYEARAKREIKEEDSLVPMERRFCFYDQVHTTGTDIKHVPNAVAVLTIGKDMTFRDYAQGAYRMRGIATGQHINVFLVPEVKELMTRELEPLDWNPSIFHEKEMQFAAQQAGGKGIGKAAREKIDAEAAEGKEPETDAGRQRKGLEEVLCWLVLNSLDSDCKQFNFLVQQDLATLYRRAALESCLSCFLDEGKKKGGAGVIVDAKYGWESEAHKIKEDLTCFIEDLNLKINNEFTPTVGFMDGLKATYKKHEARIEKDQLAVKAKDRVFDRVEAMEFKSEDGGLAQEQEQEQEEEKEQETIPRADDQPVILSDLAFARTNEEQQPWNVEVLAKRDTWGKDEHFVPKIIEFEKKRLEAKKGSAAGTALASGSERDPSEGEQHGPAFYRASEFSIHHGEKISDFPSDLWFSRNFYNPAWTGPRRIKNMIMLLEVMPHMDVGRRDDGEEKQRAADEEQKLRAKQAAPVIDLLWNLFASKENQMTSYAVQQVLRRVLHVENVDEKDVSLHVKAVMKAASKDGATTTTGDLTDKEQLSKLLFGQSTRGGLADRHFVAITLREAEVLRAIIHAKAREGHNPRMLIADKDVAIGLRLISSHGFPLLDQSHKFPDYNDRQLNRACQVLRFIDQQSYYTEAATFELLRVFNQTDATQRERFRRQMYAASPRGLIKPPTSIPSPPNLLYPHARVPCAGCSATGARSCSSSTHQCGRCCSSRASWR